MAEVPYGVLLSGGLDSSLVAAIAQRETVRLQKEYARQQALLSSGANSPSIDGVASLPKKAGTGEDELAGVDENYRLDTVPVLSQLNSFSIGLPGAPDSVAALETARYLGTKQ
jgi:asparagine synthase (glutamine-hydrolysing)